MLIRFLTVTIVLLLSACDDMSQDSVVKIRVGSFHGTGFFVTANTIITAAHFVHDDSTPITIEYYDLDGNIRQATATVLDKDNEYDQMILYADVVGEAAKMCDGHIGNRVQVWGWLGDEPESKSGVVYWKWRGKYYSTAEAKPGYSGGPVSRGDCVFAVHKRSMTKGGSSVSFEPRF